MFGKGGQYVQSFDLQPTNCPILYLCKAQAAVGPCKGWGGGGGGGVIRVLHLNFKAWYVAISEGSRVIVGISTRHRSLVTLSVALMSLFGGHVTCWNLPLAGPLLYHIRCDSAHCQEQWHGFWCPVCITVCFLYCMKNSGAAGFSLLLQGSWWF